MTKTIKTILRLKINYLVNGIFYYLKKMPFIKKIVPSFLRDSSGLKATITVISCILMLVKSVIFKFFYQYIFFVVPFTFLESGLNLASVFHVLIFTTIIGTGMNSKYFEVNTEKYYGVVLLRMNARGYYIGEYLYYIFELFFGYIVANGLIVVFMGGFILPPLEMMIFAIVAPIFTVFAKNIYISYKLSEFIKKGVFINENKVTAKAIVLLVLILVAGYLPPFLGYPLPVIGFVGVLILAGVLNIGAIKGMSRFQEYGYLTKQLYFGNIAILTNTFQASAITETYKKQIEINTEITSDKKGHAYLNEIFIKRHRKVLTSSANRIAIVAAVVFVVAAVAVDMNKEVSVVAADVILNNMSAMLILLYFLNRGQGITQSMFINCDSALLSYNFYKTPSAILGVFSERLKSLVLINLIPAAVIGVGISVVLMISGIVIEWYIYPLIAITIMAMSVFFSVHYLILYYLLQPYSAGLSIKNPVFSVISAATYFVCFALRDLKFNTVQFGVVVISFTAIYIVTAMFLVYKFAPKTFRLK